MHDKNKDTGEYLVQHETLEKFNNKTMVGSKNKNFEKKKKSKNDCYNYT